MSSGFIGEVRIEGTVAPGFESVKLLYEHNMRTLAEKNTQLCVYYKNEKVVDLCSQIGKTRVWTILNKIQTKEMESIMREELKKKKIESLRVVHFDDELIKVGLMGTQLRESRATDIVKNIRKI